MKFFPTRRAWQPLASLALACSLTTGAPQAAAQAYPNGPVKVILPFAVGGPTDQIGRALAAKLSELLGQQFVVENRTGASGTIATHAVARAPADGHTLLFHEIAATFAIQAELNPSLPYDVTRDFTPIGLAAQGQIFLLVNSELPVRTVEDLVTLARQQPGQISFGTAGGTGQLPTHIGPELLQYRQKVKFLHVPYKGTGPALVDVASGRVSFMMTTGTGSAQAFLDAGRLRPVAVTGKTRSAALPNVPTFVEQGAPIPELDDGTMWGLVGPRGLPPHVVQTLGHAMKRALETPELRQTFANLDINTAYRDSEALGQLMAQERRVWGRLIKDMNIQPD